jgi:cellulose synthase/poly-beta-1,6-N-acetylglucosamine synthase-like glycosyltransferase
LTDHIIDILAGTVLPWVQALLLIVYGLAMVFLLVFSLHRFVMVQLYYRNRHGRAGEPRKLAELPRVTVQLPVYNERYVVERLIRSVAAFDYPPDRFEIQVLDDSTDDTSQLAARCVDELQAAGHDICHMRRSHRSGYKAGALEAGLQVATGELVAVFDADFQPRPDFLRQTVHHFSDPAVGMVQSRWGHLNRTYSLLTRVQSIFLDGHFVMEHGARSRSGLFFNFNGTAGVWRRQCIEEAGGWQHDTLTEDLDLSYRAQMAGWRFVYLQDVVSPAEVPVEMNAWKSQQHRWAKGSVQTARKLLWKLLRSPLPWRVKGEAAIHLMANFSYLLMALVAILIFPAVLSRLDLGIFRVIFVDFPLFFAATGAVSRFYLHAQKEIYSDWATSIKHMPLVLAIGMGISLNNARGVLEALVGWESAFKRTPKYNVVSRTDAWRGKRYAVSKSIFAVLEIGIGAYFWWVIAFCLGNGVYFPVPFLALFSLGFIYVGWTSVYQGAQVRLRPDYLGVPQPAVD